MVKLFKLTLCVVLLTCAWAYAGNCGPLKGQIDLRARLDSLTESNPVGDFGRASNRWFELPHWLCGTWESLSSLQTREIDERNKHSDENSHSINEARQVVLGWQKDKLGEIWQREDEISYREVKSEQKDSEQAKNKPRREIDSCSNTRLLSETGDSVLLEKIRCIPKYSSSGKWQGTERFQQLCSYKLINPDLIVEECDLRQFDPEGLPVKTRRTFALLRRIQEFQPLEHVGDLDMKVSFCKFLSDTNRLDRIPR